MVIVHWNWKYSSFRQIHFQGWNVSLPEVAYWSSKQFLWYGVYGVFWSVLGTTVGGQNIQTLQHALCWSPAPPNLNVSARVLAKVMLGVWFLSSIGANALQVTLTLNFGGEGVIPNRRGLNISSIYGTNRGVRHAAHPSWYCLALWCFHIFWSPNSVVETSLCMLLIFFQTAQNIAFSYVTFVLPVPFFLFPNSQLIPNWKKHCVFNHRLHLSVKTQRFLQLGISCELGNRKNGTVDRKEAFTYEKAMFCAVWNKISSMQSDVSTTEFGDQKMWKHQRVRR